MQRRVGAHRQSAVMLDPAVEQTELHDLHGDVADRPLDRLFQLDPLGEAFLVLSHVAHCTGVAVTSRPIRRLTLLAVLLIALPTIAAMDDPDIRAARAVFEANLN